MTPKFKTLNAARKAYRRCRTRKHFILTGTRDLCNRCACCGERLDTFADDVTPGYRGNRCEYLPRSKTFIVRHYLCAWGQTMRMVNRVGRAMQGG